MDILSSDFGGVKRNKYLLFIKSNIYISDSDCYYSTSSNTYSIEVYGIKCYFYCVDIYGTYCSINSNDKVLFYAYIPFRCEDDVNKTYYLNIGDTINIFDKIRPYFNSPYTYYIKFINLPSSIGIFTYNENNIITNFYYYYYDYLKFQAIKLGTTNLSFKANIFNNVDYNYTENIEPCPMTLKICWVGCETCEGYEDATISNQSCYDCKNGYAFNKTYKNSDNHDLGNCFTDSTEIPGYYILGRNFEKCDESCLRCEIQSTNCSECANGYYRKDGTSREECFKKENNLYLNETDNILYYCHENCESCSEGGDNFNNKCDKCIENYYFYEDKETHIKNCVENSPLDNYYLDKTDNTFYECYKRCALCQYPGNDLYQIV